VQVRRCRGLSCEYQPAFLMPAAMPCRVAGCCMCLLLLQPRRARSTAQSALTVTRRRGVCSWLHLSLGPREPARAPNCLVASRVLQHTRHRAHDQTRARIALFSVQGATVVWMPCLTIWLLSGCCYGADARRVRDACAHCAGGSRPGRVPAVPGKTQAAVQSRGEEHTSHRLVLCAFTPSERSTRACGLRHFCCSLMASNRQANTRLLVFPQAVCDLALLCMFAVCM
jgi:hypothetical protein